MTAGLVLEVAASMTTCVMMWRYGDRTADAPWWGLASVVLFTGLMFEAGLWGLAPLNLGAAVVHVRNLWKARRDRVVIALAMAELARTQAALEAQRAAYPEIRPITKEEGEAWLERWSPRDGNAARGVSGVWLTGIGGGSERKEPARGGSGGYRPRGPALDGPPASPPNVGSGGRKPSCD